MRPCRIPDEYDCLHRFTGGASCGSRQDCLTWILAGAFVFHTTYIMIRWVHSGYSPVVNSFEALSFIAWAVSGVYLAFQARTRTRVLGAFVAPLALLLSIAASAGVIGAVKIPDTLKASWVTIHVVCSLVGCAFFALACCSSIMYLVQDNLIRKRRIDSLNRFLPPLRDLDRINHISAVWGFLLLTLGIIAGAIGARDRLGKPSAERSQTDSHPGFLDHVRTACASAACNRLEGEKSSVAFHRGIRDSSFCLCGRQYFFCDGAHFLVESDEYYPSGNES